MVSVVTLSFPNSHLALRARRLESQPCSKVVAGKIIPFLRRLIFQLMPPTGLRVFDYHPLAWTQEVGTGHYAYDVSSSVRPSGILGEGRAGDGGCVPLRG